MSCLCSHVQHEGFILLKQAFLGTPLKKCRFSLQEKVSCDTAEGRKSDFRTCVINDTASFSSWRRHKPPRLLSKLCAPGHFVAGVVKDIVNT